MKTILQIKEDYHNGAYSVSAPKWSVPDDRVIDEDKSVKWNREEVARLRKEYVKKIDKYNEERVCLLFS